MLKKIVAVLILLILVSLLLFGLDQNLTFDEAILIYPAITWEELEGESYELLGDGIDFHYVSINGVIYIVRKL
jgi:hypothetical protein